MIDNLVTKARRAIVVDGKDFYAEIALRKDPRRGWFIQIQHYTRQKHVKRQVKTFLKSFDTIGDGMRITSKYEDPPRATAKRQAAALNGGRGQVMIE